MKTDDTAVLAAWSNGRWIYLDLDRSRYYGGQAHPDPVFADAHVAATAALRDQPSETVRLLPTRDEIWHYARCARLAWQLRRRPLRDQLAAMSAQPMPTKPRTAQAAAVARFAVNYQNMRNLRLRRPLCLEDSVACALFLRRYVDAPTFCVGVVQPPFMGHAWVQVGDMIVNDAKEVVERYSTILATNL